MQKQLGMMSGTDITVAKNSFLFPHLAHILLLILMCSLILIFIIVFYVLKN